MTADELTTPTVWPGPSEGEGGNCGRILRPLGFGNITHKDNRGFLTLHH